MINKINNHIFSSLFFPYLVLSFFFSDLISLVSQTVDILKIPSFGYAFIPPFIHFFSNISTIDQDIGKGCGEGMVKTGGRSGARRLLILKELVATPKSQPLSPFLSVPHLLSPISQLCFLHQSFIPKNVLPVLKDLGARVNISQGLNHSH